MTFHVNQITAKGRVTIAFPDVCKTPGGGAMPNPIPYPSFAKVANDEQKKKKNIPNLKAVKYSTFTPSTGGEAGVKKGVVSVKNNEILLLKKRLNSLNQQVQSLTSKDPNVWQRALEEYVVAASAIFITQNANNNG